MQTRQLYFIDATGHAMLQGDYPDLGGGVPWNIALDSQGRLYEDLGYDVVRSSIDGTHTVIDKNGRGGIAALLVTGQY